MLILASASIPRHHLLQQAEIPHEVIISHINEESFKFEDPNLLVKNLAIAKAKAVLSKLTKQKQNQGKDSHEKIVLGCDSIFLFENQIFGKPQSSEQAIERWKKMSSNGGHLITGHALLYKSRDLKESKGQLYDQLISGVITTQVIFSKLTKKEIKDYVKTGEPLNCAGGFALEGKGGVYIESIEGCYSNVIGLSLPWLRKSLKEIELIKNEF